jgi:hypothetical protein
MKVEFRKQRRFRDRGASVIEHREQYGEVGHEQFETVIE